LNQEESTTDLAIPRRIPESAATLALATVGSLVRKSANTRETLSGVDSPETEDPSISTDRMTPAMERMRSVLTSVHTLLSVGMTQEALGLLERVLGAAETRRGALSGRSA
jgi:hypothetical protein